MHLSLPPERLRAYVTAQIEHQFPDGGPLDFGPSFDRALERLEFCFAHIMNKYFFDGSQSVFSHLHADQYAMWLYILSNQLHRDGGNPDLCAKLFLLNKALHGCDLFHEVALPDIFLLVHPLGTVLGRGDYANFFVAYQRCGVGSNHDTFPSFGEHVTLRPGSSVLGAARIGAHCQLGAEALLIDRDLEERTLYLGTPKAPILRPNREDYPLWRAR
ncbi:MAG: hypothetical protein WA918_08510 [Erythrobacter sp.]